MSPFPMKYIFIIIIFKEFEKGIVTKQQDRRLMDDEQRGGGAVPDFEEVYRLYFADVYKYILALSRDEATAEEVTQETFFKALTAIDSFRGDCQLRVWLCQIARNQYLSLCRERQKFTDTAPEQSDSGIEAGFADREDALRLHVLLHGLPEPYKEVFSLRTFGELPFSQIGALFGKTESWARVTYFRARQKLKEGFHGT